MVIGYSDRACMRYSRHDAEEPHQEHLDGPAAKSATVAEHG